MPRTVFPTPFVICPPETIATDVDLRRMSRELATKYAENHAVTDADLKTMGRMLWNVLGIQDDFDAAVKSASGAILSVIIESNRPEVQAFPWEVLDHPMHGFIGRNLDFTLTRRITGGILQTTLNKGPLRVLLFTSLPDNVNAERGRLNVEEEQAQVQEALLPWIANGVVQLEMPDDGRFSTLKELLESFDPHVLFLSGHGKFHHEPHADETYGTFWFESETGDGESIRDEEIARALSDRRVQAVILSACESGKAASDSLSNGLMQRISTAGIPHVIGMRESILDIAGIQFARRLCDELAGQERLDVALQSARAAIQQTMDERGQWCLPMALSPNPQAGLIDWDFQPQAAGAQRLNQRVNTVSLPARFVGRRAEMRMYKIKLTQGVLRSLLITGAGGMGKTSLAGKLALDVQKARGDGLFAWSANSEKSWRDFELEMGQTLDKLRVERYDKFLPTAENEAARAKFMLDLLVEQFNGRVILFFDNLETLQDADSLAVKDATVTAWMQAASHAQDVTLLATSRWQIPDWDGEHLMLARANYGDFLQIAALKNLPIKREQMRRIYDVLGGNIRGLEFFAAAVQGMDDETAEEAFLQTLAQTKSDLQANMAIAEIFKRLPDDAKKLLARLPAYHEAVPMEGLLKLGEDLPNAETLLERLTAVSLLEASYNSHWDVTEYQCPQMVTDWMNRNGLIDESPNWLNAAADYHLYLLTNEHKTLPQAIITHYALRRAQRNIEADRMTLEIIVLPLMRTGLHMPLLDKWLPIIYNSQDAQMRSKALRQTGKLLIDLGDYASALLYCEKSLDISRQIGDQAGEAIALNNIAGFYFNGGDYETAILYFKQALEICKQIKDKVTEGEILSNMSQIDVAWGDYDTALSRLTQALEIQRSIGNAEDEGITLRKISSLHRSRGAYDVALSYLKQALVIQQKFGDKNEEAQLLEDFCVFYKMQGDYATALFYLKQSLGIQEKIGNKLGEGNVLMAISELYHSQGDYDTALSYSKKALVIMQQLGNKSRESSALNNIGALYYAWGDYKLALTYIEKSLEIDRQIGARSGKGGTLNNIAQVYEAQGDYATALFYLNQSLEIHQKMGSKGSEGVALNNISRIYHAQRDYDKALAYLKQALEIQQQIGDKSGKGHTLNNISQIYYALEDYDTALPYAEQSLEISRQIGDKKSEGAALNNISQIYYSQGDHETALPYLKQSLVIKQQNGDIKGESVTLNNIAQILKSQGDFKTALEYSERDLSICKQIGDKAGETITHDTISEIYEELEDYEAALFHVGQALVIRKQLNDTLGVCQTLLIMGNLYSRCNMLQEALNAWVSSYVIAKKIDAKGPLQNLTILANMLQLPEGLDGWETLAQRMQLSDQEDDEDAPEEEVEEMLRLTKKFVQSVVKAVREQSPEVENYYKTVSKMAADEGSPKSYELGKVLKEYIECGKKPNLSRLVWEFAEIVDEAIDDSGVDENDEQKAEREELKQVKRLVHVVVQSAREKSREAERYYQSVSEMATDTEVPPEYQELGKVLRDYMVGVKNLDLSHLPERFAKVVREKIKDE